MLKKLIVSFLCAIVVACTVLGGFCLLYFTIPSQKAKASISLPSTVEDSETAAESTTEADSKDKNVYVAMCISLLHFVQRQAQILTRLQTFFL